ncbi:ATP synthase subunit I [Heyndrickxia acidicola]|uniref:ATP synthase subunit I n=1 Tax=Heyndrickxia acidicola TaxID=209389 RepID=A0ABU6MIM8_9BACI|nr:ATP synthase subunit I [Heyndrickxia acidicola]MED1202920.1 ATP synthase subunit I [Heyndrickxia acidicola]
MPELQKMHSRHRKYILYLLSLFVLGWGFTSYHSIFLGLILGTIVSLFNSWQLMRKTISISDAVAQERKARSLGTITRMGTALIAVMVASRYPETFHFLSVVIGLMTSYFVIMIDFAILTIQSHK